MPYVFDLDDPPDLPVAALEALLGGKGANLAVMAKVLGLPVPPGFTVTTAACREYLSTGWPATLDEEIRAHMARVEERLERGFGDPADPLLVSVRSGAPLSMPGMMDTILDVGLNAATARGLAAVSGDAAFAEDCHRRLRGMYRDVVGVDAPDDPWAQLRGAIEAVFRSWNGQRARAYRLREAIADDLGTAVTVQAMVFGNRDRRSASGVLFTRNPATGEPTLYGDVLFGSQGEDVVAGTHETEPLSTLDDRLPEVAAQLRRFADLLERHYADLCDIEFTIEQGTLWLLQVRVGKRSAQAALRVAVDMASDDGFPLSREEAVRRVVPLLLHPPTVSTRRSGGPPPLAVGLPASPGVASGEIVTTAEAAEAAGRAGRAAILVRPETSPHDVRGMAQAAGVLTTRGGLASHAAVVARGWGIPAVVGAQGVEVTRDGLRIDGATLPIGAVITVDGSSGQVFAGALAEAGALPPELAVLRGWARELGSSLGEVVAATAPDDEAGRRAATAEDVVRALLVKGLVGVDALAIALGSSSDAIGALIDGLLSEGFAEPAADAWRLTRGGRLRAAELFSLERELLGRERAIDALDRFVELDRRVKETVSDWQLRSVDGAQAPNDHGDAGYDADVLDRLGTVHADAMTWLPSLSDSLPRFAVYRTRLERALDLARRGDGRYVASPRVESYHGVWFELHEDLIRLAGRTRSEEAAAGRA